MEEISPRFQTKLFPCMEGIASSTASLEVTIKIGSIKYQLPFEGSIMTQR